MKIGTVSTFLLFGLGSLAQQVRIISPTANTTIIAGTPFTATVAIAPTTSSVDVLALLFAIKLINPNAPETPDLGEPQLATIFAPTFPNPGPVGFHQDVELTIPADLFTGLNKLYNLTCGEFFSLGALNTPVTLTSQVTVFVASN